MIIAKNDKTVFLGFICRREHAILYREFIYYVEIIPPAIVWTIINAYTFQLSAVPEVINWLRLASKHFYSTTLFYLLGAELRLVHELSFLAPLNGNGVAMLFLT